MQFSVVIVNYNVRHFLEQCLYSVEAALQGMEGEVIVVDNDSRDRSIEYLQPSFPRVKFVQNAENAGFAKACNQGLALSSGRYVLFLNPDTILPENCFSLCLQFLEKHPEAGAREPVARPDHAITRAGRQRKARDSRRIPSAIPRPGPSGQLSSVRRRSARRAATRSGSARPG